MAIAGPKAAIRRAPKGQWNLAGGRAKGRRQPDPAEPPVSSPPQRALKGRGSFALAADFLDTCRNVGEDEGEARGLIMHGPVGACSFVAWEAMHGRARGDTVAAIALLLPPCPLAMCSCVGVGYARSAGPAGEVRSILWKGNQHAT